MGSSNMKPQITYKTIKRQKHNIMGIIDSIQTDLDGWNKNFTLKTRSFMQLKEFQKLCNKIINRKMMNQNHLLNGIINVHHFVQRQKGRYCSNIKQIDIFYDQILQDLQIEYLCKKCNNMSYSQGQIIKIMTDVMKGISQAQENSLKIFHISKKSILRKTNNEYCLILLEDAESIHPIYDYITSFNGQMFNKTNYLSPKQLQSINSFVNLQQSNQKDHIFTLGMIILNLCLMKEFLFQNQIITVKIEQKQKFFIFQQNSIKSQLQKVRRLVTQIKHSENLKEIILKMLEFEQQKRINCKKFFQTFIQNEKMKKIEQIQLKKTSKKLRWHRKFFQRKQNLQIIPPSLLQVDKMKQQNVGQITQKYTINLITQPQHTSDKKYVIATQAKDYKKAKMSSIKIANLCQKQVISYFMPSLTINSNFTPIKKLNDAQLSKQKTQNRQLFKGIKRCIKAESIQDYQSMKTIKQNLESRTSLAANLQKIWNNNTNKYAIE